MEQTMTGMDFKIREVAGRIRELREISGFTPEEMAQRTNLSVEEYLQCEAGNRNLSIAFLYRCTLSLGVDLGDLLEGHSPKLRSYALTRKGEGQRIEEAHHMVGFNLAAGFRNRIGLPLYMELKYQTGAEYQDIELVTHEGQECDIVIRGRMKIQIGSKTEILHAGDTIYYDSATPHGMIAVGGEDCAFYAIVLSNSAAREGEQAAAVATPDVNRREPDKKKRIYRQFIDRKVEDGLLKEISFKGEEQFNFAFDIVDALGRQQPEKLATFIAMTPCSRAVFDDAHENRGSSDFERAWKFAIRSKMGHGFKTYQKTGFKIDVYARENSYAVNCWNRLPGDLLDAAGRLKSVQIENRPALDLIRKFNHDNVLIYADPPYLLNTRGGKQYRHEMTEQDHVELLAALLRHKGPVILSGYPSELYDRELKGWGRITRKSYNQNSDPRTEVLWCNFDVPWQSKMEGV
mgnify:CR=1 FL=1